MTALDRYAKLEAVARYHDGRAEARARPAREVVISFGERSLIIMGMNDEPITHWPLASLRALGPAGQAPLELAPDRYSDERLVLDDRDMSEAIAEVCPDLYETPPAPPRRRLPWRAMGAGTLLAALAAAALVVWPMLPDSMADMVPPEREAALGAAVAARVPGLLEPAAPPHLCVAEEGLAALRALSDRLAGDAETDDPLRIAVLDHPAAEALGLPGNRVLLFRGLIQAAETPEEVAGVLAHAMGHARGRDPLRATLAQSGAGAMAGLLVGDITAARVLDEATAALDARYGADAEARADAAAFQVLAAAELPSTPSAALIGRIGADARYPERHPWTPARARAAEAADTIGAAPFRPALRDRDWIALSNICDRTRPVDPAGF